MVINRARENFYKIVLYKIQSSIGFASNISNILTKQGDFGGDKTHDWHTFIKFQCFEIFIIL